MYVDALYFCTKINSIPSVWLIFHQKAMNFETCILNPVLNIESDQESCHVSQLIRVDKFINSNGFCLSQKKTFPTFYSFRAFKKTVFWHVRSYMWVLTNCPIMFLLETCENNLFWKLPDRYQRLKCQI